MKIFVILPDEKGQYLTLEQEPSDLVRSMKENIQNILDGRESVSKKVQLRTENQLEERMKVKGKLRVEDEILMINEKCLEDNKRIEDYIIKSETFVELRFDSTELRVNI